MKKKIERVALYVQLVLSSILLFFLILSDFGFIFPSTNVFARVLLHFTVIILIVSSIIQLHLKKENEYKSQLCTPILFADGDNF